MKNTCVYHNALDIVAIIRSSIMLSNACNNGACLIFLQTDTVGEDSKVIDCRGLKKKNVEDKGDDCTQ